MIRLLRRILAAGLIAGCVAGLAVTAVQQIQVVPLILAAELFESAAPAHHHDATPHEYAPGAAAHSHDSEAWAPQDGLERNLFTLLANIVAGVGYGAILVALMVFAGRKLDWQRGLLWGLGGFAAFALAPAMDLPPELPGMAAADLAARQMWWIATAGATIAGLGLIVFAPARHAALKIAVPLAGIALLALPHLLGAPEHAAEAGNVPAELAARFAVASLIAQAAFWAVLSAIAGHLLGRALPQVAQPLPLAAA